MANNYIKTINGAKIYLYRANTANSNLSSTEYLPDSQFQVGINNSTVNTSDTSLISPVPISDGTINDDGSNVLTGSSGGTNTTSNTLIFKPGANLSDNTAQNLLANNSSVSKIWSISLTNNITTTDYVGQSLYVKDTVILNKIVSVEFRYETDASNYYSVTYLNAVLNVGWNQLNPGLVNSLTLTGTVTTISGYRIIITTVNSTDTFSADDVVYDLLRSWSESDLYKDYVTNFPSVDLANLEVTKKGYLTTVDAVGFDINGYGDFNKDSTPIMSNESTFTARSKSDTDELIFIGKDRIIL